MLVRIQPERQLDLYLILNIYIYRYRDIYCKELACAIVEAAPKNL